MERELELAESRRRVQEKALHDSEAALESAKSFGLSTTMRTVEQRIKRQRLALEETNAIIAECQKAILTKAPPRK